MKSIAAKSRGMLAVVLFFIGVFADAQVKIGSAGSPNSNAVLELDGGSSKGLLLPKLNASQITALTTAPDGLLIYNTTDGFLYLRKSGAWQKMTDATNGGGFSLPYAGTASTVGGAEFSVTHTTTFGDAVYFTNSAGGAAITTAAGNNKFNMSSGNTGIGIPAGLSENPVLGKLVVRGVVGAVSAMFGDNTAGVSVMNNFPSIGLNYYYNGSSKAISAGYGSALGQDPSTGRIYLSSSAVSASGAGTAMSLVDRLIVLANGNTGIATANPGATLTVGRGSTNGGTAQFDGTTNSSHFNYSTSEDTYIRGGKATSQVLVNDVSAGNIRLAEGGGNVGIGIPTPSSKLDVRQTNSSIAISAVQTGSGFSMYAQNTNATATTFIYNAGTGPSLITLGRVGINNTDPGFALDVQGRMRLRNESAGVTSGFWLDGPAVVNRSFIGTFDNDNIGFYGVVGWGLLFNHATGQVNIGASRNANDAAYKLNVGGKILSEEVRVQLQTAWPDYVFDVKYDLRSIADFEKYIAMNKHLPGIQTASEIKKEGFELGEMNKRLLEKVEELSLYIIQLNKRMEKLENK